MIGILCNRNKVQTYTKAIFNMLHSDQEDKKRDIFVFAISDIDFSNKTVWGNLIAEDSIKFTRVPLPSVIFKFSYYRKKNNLKNIRILAGRSSMAMVNDVNIFDQYMIMDMLASFQQTKDYALDYKNYNRNNDTDGNLGESKKIILPVNGLVPGKPISIKRFYDAGYNIYQNKGFSLPPLSNSDSSTRCIGSDKKWITLEMPDLLLHKNIPAVVTLYVQRGLNGAWISLPGAKLPGVAVEPDTIMDKLNSAAIKIASHVSCFIPSLGFCTVNFVLDKNITPYFISLGGWDPGLLLESQYVDPENGFGDSFIRNLLDYYDFLSIKLKGGNGFVG